MIYLKTYKDKKCPKCGGSEYRIAYADFKEEESYELVEKYYNGELKLEDVFMIVNYWYAYVKGDTNCYFNENNFCFTEELRKELFDILEKLLKNKPSKEEFENLNGETFFNHETDNDDEDEIEYTIKGKKSDIQNMEVLLRWISYLSSVGSTRTIRLEIDGDGATNIRVCRKDGKPLSKNTIKYGFQFKDSNGEIKKLSF